MQNIPEERAVEIVLRNHRLKQREATTLPLKIPINLCSLILSLLSFCFVPCKQKIAGSTNPNIKSGKRLSFFPLSKKGSDVDYDKAIHGCKTPVACARQKSQSQAIPGCHATIRSGHLHARIG